MGANPINDWHRLVIWPYIEVTSKTIFAFLMLNTMSPAHNKIFGTKFLSFERLETMCLYTVSYAVFWRNVVKSDSQMSHFFML